MQMTVTGRAQIDLRAKLTADETDSLEGIIRRAAKELALTPGQALLAHHILEGLELRRELCRKRD